MNAKAAPPVVLVADDEPTMLELVARHLRSIDQPRLEVIEASDGDEAWRLARERLPDLVVLDVMMPGMSGWEVCRKIRQDAALAHTGVLMLTGIGETLNETTSPLFGADEYIDKPFDFENLDAKVIDVLDRRAAQRDAVPRPESDARTERDRAPVENGAGASATAAPVEEAPARRRARTPEPPPPKRVSKRVAKKAKHSKPAKHPKPAKATKRAGAKRAHEKAKPPQRRSAKVEKGKKTMAAKKAKKTAKKAAAKKTATKTAKKAKKTAKKAKKK